MKRGTRWRRCLDKGDRLVYRDWLHQDMVGKLYHFDRYDPPYIVVKEFPDARFKEDYSKPVMAHFQRNIIVHDSEKIR